MDLHRANVMIAAKGEFAITGLIDWQGVSILPLYMQAFFPACFKYNVDERIVIPTTQQLPELPEDFDQLPDEEQAHLRLHRRMAGLQKVYGQWIKEYSPLQHAARNSPDVRLMLSLIWSASRTWYSGMHQLQADIFDLFKAWDEIAPGVPFPVDLQRAEYQAYKTDGERLLGYDHCVSQLTKLFKLEGDGWVSNERYEEVMEGLNEAKRCWKVEHGGGPFPFQDGGWSWFLS